MPAGDDVTTCIFFENVYYSYGEHVDWALQGVNFAVHRGEWVTMIGGNGSGKSTIALLMKGLLIPTNGKVYIFDKETCNPEHLGEIRQKVGLVFQNPDQQIVCLTVQDDVSFGLENLGLPPAEIERRVNEIMRKLDLLAVKEQDPHFLSPGQKQKLALAGIAVMEPEIVIFDEASSMLDPQGAQVIYNMMAELHQQGMTIVHITHDLDEIEIGGRIVLLKEGRIHFDGSWEEIMGNTKLLEEAGLCLPFAARIRDALCKEGFDLAERAATLEEMAKQICKYVSGK
ncbi:ATP-binding cassette domain-containing protein [Paenibacillus sp. Root444D2]|uniref:ATP-binding cassette domain-containing protein n=1 Tax=Paenibacillus sp. Root444D2 TaxID=1736538 RepID=UPI0007C81634|nr:ATP-binding cassette domain-containing protein [Paenibacillus sp. Root444D2]